MIMRLPIFSDALPKSPQPVSVDNLFPAYPTSSIPMWTCTYASYRHIVLVSILMLPNTIALARKNRVARRRPDIKG